MTTAILLALTVLASSEKEALFEAAPIPVDGFTAGVEGPACERREISTL